MRGVDMPKLTLQVRTRKNLLDLLARGESPAWVVAPDREPLLTHVEIVNFDGTQMIQGVYDRSGSTRRDDGRLIVRFLDGHIVNCRVEFAGRNPVRFTEGQPMTTADRQEIETVASAAFRALREMDAQCPTGLCDYVSVSPYAGKQRKNEHAMTWGLTKALAEKWHIEQCEHDYPKGGGKCDRVLELTDGSRLWLEIKHIWRAWFYKVVKYNDTRAYAGYLSGAHHSHSVAGDFTKLERIGRDHARYVALLVVGFDAADGKMSADMAALAEREKLQQRGWHLLSDAWVTPQSAECWNRGWFGWREAQ